MITDATLRPTLNAAISAGNPELFLLCVMLEASRKKANFSEVLSSLQSQVTEAKHPVLITLVGLLLKDPYLSLADTSYLIRQRIDRCLTYFPKLALRYQFKFHYPIPTINPEQITYLQQDRLLHLIMSVLGEETWSSQDKDACNHLNLTKQNCGLALEQYFFHFGMTDEVAGKLNGIANAHRDGEQLTQWLRLLSAAGQLRLGHIKNLLYYPAKLNPTLLQQFALHPDEYNLATKQIKYQHQLPFPNINTIAFEQSHLATLTSQANVLRTKLCNHFPKVSLIKFQIFFYSTVIIMIAVVGYIIMRLQTSMSEPVIYDIHKLVLLKPNITLVENNRYFTVTEADFLATKMMREKIEFIPFNSLQLTHSGFNQILKKIKGTCLLTHIIQEPQDMNPLQPQCYEHMKYIIKMEMDRCYTLITEFTKGHAMHNLMMLEKEFDYLIFNNLFTLAIHVLLGLLSIPAYRYLIRRYTQSMQEPLLISRHHTIEPTEQLLDRVITIISAQENHFLKSSALYQACTDYFLIMNLPTFSQEDRVFELASNRLQHATNLQSIVPYYLPSPKPYRHAESQLRATFFAMYPTLKNGADQNWDLEALEQHALSGLNHEI